MSLRAAWSLSKTNEQINNKQNKTQKRGKEMEEGRRKEYWVLYTVMVGREGKKKKSKIKCTKYSMKKPPLDAVREHAALQLITKSQCMYGFNYPWLVLFSQFFLSGRISS